MVPTAEQTAIQSGQSAEWQLEPVAKRMSGQPVLAVMSAQLMVEAADPLLLLSDTVSQATLKHTLRAHKQTLSSGLSLAGTACVCWHSSSHYGSSNHSPNRHSQDQAAGRSWSLTLHTLMVENFGMLLLSLHQPDAGRLNSFQMQALHICRFEQFGMLAGDSTCSEAAEVAAASERQPP